MDSSIRKASMKDLERLVELENVLFENALNERRLEVEMSLGECFVIGEPAIAYALVRPDGPLLDLMRLGVLPTYQGFGFGKKLLGHVLSLGKDVVLTVLRDNVRARAMYKSAGFRTVGVLPAGAALVQFCPSESA
jgi:ribosomal protein S18 acetylase RimI-like enzyme